MAVVALPLRRRTLGRPHRPELEQAHAPAPNADAIVDEEDRTRRVELDENRDRRQERQQQNHRGHRDEQAQHVAERQIEMRLAKIARRDERARRQRFDRDLAGEAFVELDAVLDDDAVDARGEQVGHRQPSAPIGEGDDDAIGIELGDDRREPRQRSGDDRRHRRLDCLRVVDDDARDAVADAGTREHLDDQPARERIRADDQHARGEGSATGEAGGHREQEQQECSESNHR